MRLRRPSPTIVIAVLALFFALGGTAVATSHYLLTSTSQIKPSVLKKLKGNAGPQGSQGPAGAQGAGGQQGAAGPQGAVGPQGKEGPAGPQGKEGPAGPTNLSSLTEVVGSANRVPAYDETGPGGYEGVESSIATCPAGDNVVSGGSDVFAGVVAGEYSIASENHDSWIVVVANDSTYTGGEVKAYAYCAKAGQAVAATAPRAAGNAVVAQADVLLATMAQRLQEQEAKGE